MKKLLSWIFSFLLTCNLTAQWEWQSPIPTGNFIFGIDFVDANHGWAFDKFGYLISTTNGGSYWVAKNSGTGQDLTSIWFTSTDQGWITGMDGTILHKHEWDPVWTPEYPQAKSGAEIRVLPNPFSSFTLRH